MTESSVGMDGSKGSPKTNDAEAGGEQAGGTKQGLGDLLDELAELGGSKDEVSIHDIREKVGNRSFGPFLMIPAIIEISPIGGIPGLPTVIAAVVSLFAIQILLGMKHLWLPGFIEKRSFSGDKLKKGTDKIRKPAGWVDKVVRPRMSWATETPWSRGIALVILLLAATVPPLELLPFASTVPMAAILLFGLALTAKDGLVAILGGLTSLAGFGVMMWSFMSGQ